jgi:hypothetical protein
MIDIGPVISRAPRWMNTRCCFGRVTISVAFLKKSGKRVAGKLLLLKNEGLVRRRKILHMKRFSFFAWNMLHVKAV